ncbi:MAG: TIGR03619 family F420-dependent LLM class oxidoreductase [Actinomycetota bacterium]|nr:TIGR03619 family F420-dependent LLM class oxidoreductase [Actinomycetota bacterium]
MSSGARLVKYWIMAGFLAVEQLVPVAQACEALGFAGVMLPDHLFFPEDFSSKYPYSADGEIMWPADAPWPDCWVAIAAMAQATTTLQFSTGVYIAPLREVFSLAKSVGTAAAFSGGRLSCGFGAGWLEEEFTAVGQPFATRGARFDEMVQVLRLLWTGEMAEFHGAHIDFPPVRMLPAAPNVPILIGGNTRPALRRAARNDGWIATFTDIDDVARMLGELHSYRDDGPLAERPLTVQVVGSPKIARDAEALAALGVESVVVPGVALGTDSSTAAVVAGLEQFAERWMR